MKCFWEFGELESPSPAKRMPSREVSITERQSSDYHPLIDMENCKPFECPLCFYVYSEKNVPTTLPCGHSCCIDHVKSLRACFYCRTPIPTRHQVNPCYALRDAAIIFAKMSQERRDIFAMVSGNSASNSPTQNCEKMDTIMKNIEFEKKDFLLSEEIERAIAEREEQERIEFEKLIESRIAAANAYFYGDEYENSYYERPTVPTSWTPIQPSRPRDGIEMKSCGHTCTTSSLPRCCACTDLRPMRREGSYPAYVDGEGWVENANRNAGYCPSCK